MAQLADLEAALDLPIVPAPVHVSTAREHVQLANQPRLRVKRKQKDPPAPRNRALGQEEQFFATLQAGLEDGSRSYCLFLCWEHAADDQRAVPLLIEDPEDETRVYRDMVTTWDQRRGWWLKYIPFYQVLGVEEVQVRKILSLPNNC
jgi:hypothetical protein